MKSKLRSQFFWIVICGLLSLYSPNIFGQGADLYDLSTGTGTALEDMSTATQLIASGQDSVASAVTNIGFTFRFAGVDYTQFSVNSNGMLRFGGTVISAKNTSFSIVTDQPKISAHNFNIATGSNGYVKYKSAGLAPNRYLVVEWKVNLSNSTTAATNGQFQVILFETTNEIKFVYGSMASLSNFYTVGISSSSTLYSWVNLTSHISKTTGISSYNTQISSGRHYTFSPGYCKATYATGYTTTGDAITNVELGTLSYASSNTVSPWYNFYYNNAIEVPILTPGSSQTLTVQLGANSTATGRFAGAWIDYNHDMAFDASEFIGGNTVSGSPVVINFTVPAGAQLGNTRMRIRGGDNVALTSDKFCAASNSGNGETEDYVINICSPPSITTQPTNQSVCAPGPVNFSVVATGATSYQWRKNGVNLTNGGNITGTTTTNLSFSSTSLADAGTYDCFVSSSSTCKIQSNPATLTINQNPSITVQPVNTTACEGASASLSVTALGSGITYRWYKNGAPMSNSGNISGATSNTLVFGPAGTTDAANYYCVVSGGSPCVSSVNSNTVALTLTVSPSAPTTTGATRCGAGSVTLSASGAVAGESYIWYDAGIAGSMIAAMTASYATPSIAVTTNYFVTRVNTSTGCESSPRTPVTATINSGPSFIVQPTSQSIGIDGSGSFNVSAIHTTGYQWQVSTDNGTTWSDIANGGVYSGATTSTLSITSAPVGMNGYKYRCNISGGCPPVASSNAVTLTVSDDYWMPSGITSRTTCFTNFYDNGGPGGSTTSGTAGNYTTNFNGTTTFYPATPGSKIRITFNSCSTELNSDFVYLYDGNSTFATPLINGASGNSILTGNTYTSTASDGSLTFRFTEDGGINRTGWDATVTCVAGPAMTFNSSTTTTASTAMVTQSATMEPVICIKVVTSNASNPFNATQFQINMTGTTSISDVTAIKIYSTGNNPVFGTTNLFGTATPATGTISVNGSQLLVPDTNYFWVAYDVSANAVVSNLLDAQCTQITMDGGIGNKIPTVENPSGSRPIAVMPNYFIKKVGTYGWARSIVEDPSDQGLVLCGDASNGANTDFCIVKTDKYGTYQWSKFIGGGSVDYGRSIITSGDGGFVFTGYSSSSNLQPDGFGTDNNIVVTKINSTGTVQWTTTVGSTNSNDESHSIIRTTDGGYAMTGSYYDGNPYLFLLKLNSDGSFANLPIFKYSTYGSYANKLIQTSDGGFLIVGNTQIASDNDDFLVMKIKSDFTLDWSMVWGGNNEDILNAVVENSPNDYTVFGVTNSYANGLNPAKATGGSEMYAMRFTNSGTGPTVKWNAIYGTAESEDARDAVATTNGGYIVTGYTNGIGLGGNEIYIMSLDNAAGDIRWTTTLGTISGDEGSAITKTSDGGFAIAALGEQGSATGAKMYLLKVKDTPQYTCSYTGSGGTKTALTKPTIAQLTTTTSPAIQTKITPFDKDISTTSSSTVAAGEAVVNVCSNVTLPIELLSFTANCKKDKVACKWITASETNNEYFTLERSYDAIHFEAVAKINGAGNSNSELKYDYQDHSINGSSTYYRLRQTDYDGKFSYSRTISTNCNTSNELDWDVYPNPTNQLLNVVFNDENTDEYSVEVKNYLGMMIMELKVPIGTQKIQLSLADLMDGTYFITVKNKHQHSTHKIVKINQ